MLKGTKRMTNVHYVGLFRRLINRACAKELKISRLEYARLRIDYEFQRRDNLLRRQLDIIEHDVNEPEYLKENEIAGYYGNVSLEALKNGFGNYFPIYQNAPPTEVKQEEITQEVIQEVHETLSEEIIVDIVPKPAQELHTVPLLADAQPSEKKDHVEPTRKRKYKPREVTSRTRKSARISHKETEDALSYLQKEFDAI